MLPQDVYHNFLDFDPYWKNILRKNHHTYQKHFLLWNDEFLDNVNKQKMVGREFYPFLFKKES